MWVADKCAKMNVFSTTHLLAHARPVAYGRDFFLKFRHEESGESWEASSGSSTKSPSKKADRDARKAAERA